MDAVAYDSVLNNEVLPEEEGPDESLLPFPPIIPDPPLPPDEPDQSDTSHYSGVNVLNYTEQGGARTVIGGELTFEDGAKVSGFPSDAAYYDLDLDGIDLELCEAEPVDVSDSFSLETFVEASQGKRPVLFRNGIFMDRQVSVVSCSAQYEDFIVGLWPVLFDLGGQVETIATFLLYVEGDKVFFRVNFNNGKSDIADPEPPPEEFVKRAQEVMTK